jgi:hypothetical protein
MGKRSPGFARLRQDKYLTTDPEPVRRLQPHLPHRGIRFAEPCAGDGDLALAMEWFGHQCVYASDVSPGREWIAPRDALTLDRRWSRRTTADMVVTNPPWSRPLLHALLDHLPALLPTWILCDADWAHTGQAAPYIDRCAKIVSVGRVKWFGDQAGVDNAAWYFFPHPSHSGGPIFAGLA